MAASPDRTSPPGQSAGELQRQRSPFWLCFWMGVFLFLTKAWRIWWPSPYSADELLRYGSEVLTVSAADAMFALVVGMTVKLLLWLTRKLALIQKSVWWAAVAFCAGCVVYAVVSIPIYDILRMPLTYPLLCLAGDVANFQSSAASFLTPGFVAATVVMPTLFVLLSLASHRWLEFRRTPLTVMAQMIGVVFIGVWYGLAIWLSTGDWGRLRNDPRMADNPHYAFIASAVAEMVGRPAPDLQQDYPTEYLDDFRVVGERGEGGAITPDLPRGPRNVIVVVCETVGTQFLSLYGSRFQTWPRMEAAAANSLVFDNFYSHLTQTPNSLAALTLSIYPPMTWRQYTTDQPNMPGRTVAELVKARGYRTAFISAGNNDFANQNGFLKNRGFDLIQDGRDSGCEKLTSWGVEDRCMVDMILRFIDAEKTQPFYVFAWTQGTHHPYQAAPSAQKIDFLGADETYGDMTAELARYLNALFEADRQLGRLLDNLRVRGLENDTIVLITGDHGEAFGVPHNTYYHSGNVYQEDVNVPLLIWSPALFKSPQRSTVVGAHVDLSPTVLDFLGMSAPSPWQGHSLFHPRHPGRAYFHGLRENFLLGVRQGRFKYIFNATKGTEELFDLSSDPTEQLNLAPGEADACLEFRRRLAAWVDYQKRFAR